MLYLHFLSIYSSISIHYFQQSIDHKNAKKFKQRYYENNEHHQKRGPMILYLGGESALKKSSVSAGLGLTLAKHFNGRLFGLEHRYYGVSQPFKDLKTGNLRYLSSEYALKDISKFIEFINKQTHNKHKWIVLGGSYSGNLSAWSRLKYPDLIYASIASSAPIKAKEDFYEYDYMESYAIGEKCLDYYSEFVRSLDAASQSLEQMENLKDQFKCSEIKDNKLFLYVLADIMASIVQYSTPGSDLGIDKFCSILTEEPATDEEMRILIARMYKDYLMSRNQTCYDFSAIEEIKNTKINENFSSRQWTYQTCTEFGYWQTAPKNEYKTTRSSLLNVGWFNQFFCGPEFFGRNIGPANVERTNSNYGALKFNGTRVIFTNGEFDPWSTLSFNDTTMSTPDKPVLIIKGGSHVNDLTRLRSTDSIYVNNTRSNIINILNSWILH